MQERVRELESKYKRFLIKKYLKYLFFFIFLLIITMVLIFGLQKYNQQRIIYFQALEHKTQLEQKIMQAQILQEKNKISKEKLNKEIEELKQNQKNFQFNKIEISSKILNITRLKNSFYQNPSYEKALNLANIYFENKAYKKSVFWALKANELDKKKHDSWLIFIKAKKALGEEKEAQIAFNAYESYYPLMDGE